MFFWFTNDTFSIIDALMKLILVITGSALIICFCHKLTNYKKSRRYKSNSLTTINQHDPSDITIRNFPGAGSINGSSLQQTIATNPHLLAYDPYNTIRPFNCLNQPELTGLTSHLEAQLTNAYGYHHSGSPFYNSSDSNNNLTTHFNQQSPSLLHHQLDPASGAPISPQTTTTSTSNHPHAHQTTLITNPIYSTNLSQPGDCSSFRAQLIEQPPPEQDVCPSYEEAIAASNNHSSIVIHEGGRQLNGTNSSSNTTEVSPVPVEEQLESLSSPPPTVSESDIVQNDCNIDATIEFDSCTDASGE